MKLELTLGVPLDKQSWLLTSPNWSRWSNWSNWFCSWNWSCHISSPFVKDYHWSKFQLHTVCGSWDSKWGGSCTAKPTHLTKYVCKKSSTSERLRSSDLLDYYNKVTNNPRSIDFRIWLPFTDKPVIFMAFLLLLINFFMDLQTN